MKNKMKTAALVRAAMFAALYVVLTLLSNLLGLASGAIQLRLSEVLCILPIFFPEAIVGLTLGCLISNIITGCILPDIIFGTLATLIGAFGTYAFKKHKFIATLPPVVSNMIIVPLVLKYAYRLGGAWWYMVITVGIGEFVACSLLGLLFYKMMSKNRRFFE
ncbi:MAG: QueT transporter family protein [Clostridia bacterium]|nr:QueT transporter family protein [Clostridia bacterium]